MLDLGKQAKGSHFMRLSEGLTGSELLKGRMEAANDEAVRELRK